MRYDIYIYVIRRLKVKSNFMCHGSIFYPLASISGTVSTSHSRRVVQHSGERELMTTCTYRQWCNIAVRGH